MHVVSPLGSTTTGPFDAFGAARWKFTDRRQMHA
jgi:hypothetical protein